MIATRIAQITNSGGHGSAARGQRSREFVQLCLVTRDRNDVRAFRRQCRSNRPAEPPRSTRHQRAAALNPQIPRQLVMTVLR